MRDLGLSRLSEDGTYLIARDAESGEEFRIRADHRAKSLIDALSPTDKAARGQLEIKMESSLSPRDIQTRIRRGESPDMVADAAGVDVDRIMAFAVPVLAEREYMVDQARKTVIRRKNVAGAGVILGTLVDERLLARGGSPEAAAWDSWRREDGRWDLHITPEGASEAASFIFDVRGRYVLPADELANDLVGDIAVAHADDMAIAEAVRSQIDEVLEAAAAGKEHPEGVSSLKDARDRRAMGQLALGDDTGEVSAPRLDDKSDAFAKEVEAAYVEEYDQEEIAHGVAVPDLAGPSSQQRKKRHERRRVPSWDEIMFGGKPEGE
ncbi:MAG: septation protein SepH [Aeromicrobium sp.]